MRQPVYESFEGNNNEACDKLHKTTLQPKTVVDASSLGQLGDAIKRPSPRRKVGIDADRIDDLILYASQRKPPSSPLQSPTAPLKTAPSMVSGVGGFNIDPPVQGARLPKGDIAVAHMPLLASPGPNLV